PRGPPCAVPRRRSPDGRGCPAATWPFRTAGRAGRRSARGTGERETSWSRLMKVSIRYRNQRVLVFSCEIREGALEGLSRRTPRGRRLRPHPVAAPAEEPSRPGGERLRPEHGGGGGHRGKAR